MSNISRAQKSRNNRRTNLEVNLPQPATPILINTASAAASVLTLTFDQPVILRGVPAINTDVAGATPVSAAQPAANQVAITYSAAVATATSLQLPFRDPSIRNASGGYLISNVYPMAA